MKTGSTPLAGLTSQWSAAFGTARGVLWEAAYRTANYVGPMVTISVSVVNGITQQLAMGAMRAGMSMMSAGNASAPSVNIESVARMEAQRAATQDRIDQARQGYAVDAIQPDYTIESMFMPFPVLKAIKPTSILSQVANNGAKVSSLVKANSIILKLAKETFSGNNFLRKEANGLIEQLNKGNMNSGIGTKNIGKSIFEARSRGGARVYFRNGQNGAQIVGGAFQIVAKRCFVAEKAQCGF